VDHTHTALSPGTGTGSHLGIRWLQGTSPGTESHLGMYQAVTGAKHSWEACAPHRPDLNRAALINGGTRLGFSQQISLDSVDNRDEFQTKGSKVTFAARLEVTVALYYVYGEWLPIL